MQNSLANLSGIIPPMITPLADRDTLDHAGLSRLIEHQINGGVNGLFILGTCGESAALSANLRRDLITRCSKQIASRIPLLVGVTDTCLSESIQLARHAASAGAAAVVVSSPFYLPLEQDELISFVRALAAEQPLPIFLYNIPSLTKTPFAPESVLRLADLPQVIGIKDSSADPAYLTTLQHRIARKDWRFFVGSELLMADAVMAGAHGGVTGGALIAPRLFVALYEAALNRDAPRVQVLQQGLRIIDRIYTLSPGIASIIRGLKCALACMNISSDQMAAPHRPCTEAERSAVRQLLQELVSANLTPAQKT